MKLYIVGISILFLIGTYFFITNSSNNQQTINNKGEEVESTVNYNDNDVEVNEKEQSSKQIWLQEKNNKLVEKSIEPIEILQEIFSLRNGNKDDVALQKKIASLESTLVSKLQNKSEQDTYNMFKKLLNSEESNIEEQKYVIDFLDAIGTKESKSLLVETYQNSEEEELKEKISKLDTPEIYTLLALEANKNDDRDNYQLMMNKLEEKNEEAVIDGFMVFTKSDDADSLDNIIQLTTQWSSSNLSKRSAEISESYLAKGDAEPRERIVAISLLSNMENKEQRDKILRKALEYEDNEDVLNFIQTTLDREN